MLDALKTRRPSDSSQPVSAITAEHLGLEILAEIAESSLDAITVADQAGRFVYANPAACEMLGYSAQELIGHDLVFPTAERDRERILRMFEKGWSGRGASTIVRPNGEEREIEFSAVWIEAEGHTYTVGITRDVTEIRRLEREGQALMQIASSVAYGGSLKSTLNDICRHVVSATGAEAALIALKNPETQQFTTEGMHGLSEEFVETMNKMVLAGVRLPLLETIEAGQIVCAREIREAVLSVPEYEPLHEHMRNAPWDTVLIAPLVFRNSVAGALVGQYLPTHEIGEAEQNLHIAIADQAAVAVENARLFAQVQEKTVLEQRQHLARELHDSISQALFSINLTARGLESSLRREETPNESALKKLTDLRQLTQGALAEMRALIFELRPGALAEEGLLQALRKHAAAVANREQFQVEVLCPGEESLPRLKTAAEDALYRIAQEALHNVVKHAGASRVEITLAPEGGFLNLSVEDNGQGFDPGQVSGGHLGLGTMGQRANSLGGECVVESEPGGGTKVRVRVPVAEWRL